MKKRTPHSSAGRCPVSHREGFTLMEVLLVIAIITVLATITVLILDPAEYLAQSRDSNRVNELKTLDNAVELALFSDSGVDGTTDSVVYLSLPDTNGNPNDDC